MQESTGAKFCNPEKLGSSVHLTSVLAFPRDKAWNFGEEGNVYESFMFEDVE